MTDSGPGIPPEDHERIFAAFEHGARDGGSGSGIGLALARKLIELHRGAVSLRSTPGSGSEFVVELPMAGREDAPASPSPSTAEPADPASGAPDRAAAQSL